MRSPLVLNGPARQTSDCLPHPRRSLLAGLPEAVAAGGGSTARRGGPAGSGGGGGGSNGASAAGVGGWLSYIGCMFVCVCVCLHVRARARA